MMTDEERKKLCEALRSIEAEYADELLDRLHEAGMKAADEIERLTMELKRVKDLLAHAEGALLKISYVAAEFTRTVIDAGCEYGKQND